MTPSMKRDSRDRRWMVPAGRRAKARCAGALLALLLGAGAAAAQSAPPPDRPALAQMTALSDLVFRGVAEDVEYVLSEPGGPEATRVPYTFVTYRVKEVLRGQAPGDTVTLRFIGGLDARTGDFLVTSITPSIETGDEDILFVAGNTESLVPLVGAASGRFRVVGNQVYTEMGNAVVAGNGGGIEVGRQYRLKEVETLTVQDGPTLKTDLGPDALDLPSDAMTAERFELLVGAAARWARPAGPFVNADASRPVPAPDMTPGAPPPLSPDQGAPAPADVPQQLPPGR
jgi:hypothetical protein